MVNYRLLEKTNGFNYLVFATPILSYGSESWAVTRADEI
jgi:hypothetical protein